MPDTDPTAPATGDTRGFPFFTAAATLAGLFLFFGLVLVVYDQPNFLGGPKPTEKADPVARLNEVKARNQAVLDGTEPGVKMPVSQATAEVTAFAEKHNRLPFPAEQPKAK